MVDNRSDDGSTISYFPIIEYVDLNRNVQVYRFTSTTSFVKYKIGQNLNIVYSPINNQDLIVLDRFGIWGDVLGFAICGIFSILVGISLFFV
ncbi:MAG: DUF3592 domain-containing protein [Saprospiraceae bacterium]|nr:DUF3592 domain-containing protein [Saprospiraceae bacterium]